MSNSKEGSQKEEALGPSVVFGLVGAVVVLLLLAGGIWGVGKIISKIREGGEDQEEEQVAESEEDTEDTEEESASQGEDEESQEGEDIQDDGEETEEDEGINGDAVFQTAVWIANDYGSGDINGETYTVVWGDTLWEIAEARYGSGFEWKKIRDENASKIGRLPDGSMALIFPGQVLNLP